MLQTKVLSTCDSSYLCTRKGKTICTRIECLLKWLRAKEYILIFVCLESMPQQPNIPSTKGLNYFFVLIPKANVKVKIRKMRKSRGTLTLANPSNRDSSLCTAPRRNNNFKVIAHIPLANHTARATTWMASRLVRASQESNTLTPSCKWQMLLPTLKLQNKLNDPKKLAQ